MKSIKDALHKELKSCEVPKELLDELKQIEDKIKVYYDKKNTCLKEIEFYNDIESYIRFVSSYKNNVQEIYDRKSFEKVCSHPMKDLCETELTHCFVGSRFGAFIVNTERRCACIRSHSLNKKQMKYDENWVVFDVGAAYNISRSNLTEDEKYEEIMLLLNNFLNYDFKSLFNV